MPPKTKQAAPDQGDGLPSVVRIGTATIKLGSPPSLALRYDVVEACGVSEVRGRAAALGMCWEAGGSPHAPARWSKHGYKTLAYGGAVVDELLKRGIAMSDIMEAGAVAFMRLMSALPSQEAVESAENFTAAEQED